jgi:hypothetical protein
MRGKAFSTIYLFSFTLMIAGVTAFNYRVDAWYLFSRLNILEKVSDDLLAGKIIEAWTWRFELDDRYLQKIIIAKMKEIPDIIVLGSSRSMMLREGHFGVKRRGGYFNHSVSGANLKDYIAIVGCYARRGALPQTVIVEITPALFDRKSMAAYKWKSYAEDYYYGMSVIGNSTSPVIGEIMPVYHKITTVGNLVSYTYAAANLQFLLSGEDRGYKIGTCTYADAFLLMPDGSMYYPVYQRSGASFDEEKMREYVQVMKGHVYDPSLERLFVTIIDYLQARGTKIVFFLPPYHPMVYREVVEQLNLKYVYRYERAIKAVAQSRNIPAVGSYDPNILHLSEKLFYDVVHTDDAYVGDLFKAYRRAAGRDRYGKGDTAADEPLQKEYHWLEAEHADSMVPPLQVAHDDTASGVGYMYSPVNESTEFPSDRIMATYAVTVAQGGEYVLWGMVQSVDRRYNSFFVEIDEGHDCLWEVETGEDWHWDMVNFRDRSDPVKFILSKGVHRIKVKLREEGTKLDKLCLTNDIDYIPSGEGTENIPVSQFSIPGS